MCHSLSAFTCAHLPCTFKHGTFTLPGKVADGTVPFLAIRACGHVISAKAIRSIGIGDGDAPDCCPLCEKSLGDDKEGLASDCWPRGTVPINPNEAQRELLEAAFASKVEKAERKAKRKSRQAASNSTNKKRRQAIQL
eukprot:SAG31_NODE_564_length_14059_cov_5.728940_14_plen_138_part_00